MTGDSTAPDFRFRAPEYPDKDTIMDLARQVHATATFMWVKTECGLFKTADDELLAAARESLAWIVPFFERFTQPDPAELGTIGQPLQGIVGTLSEDVKSRLDSVKFDLHDWEAEAVEASLGNFIEPSDRICDHQIDIAGILSLAADANRDMYTQVRQAAKDLAEQTLTSLEALDDTDGGGLAVVLGVTAAVATGVAGVLTIPISGGTSLWAAGAAGATIIAGISSGAAVGTNTEDPVEVPLEGDSVD
ncbi:MAG: hypothetical protein ACRD0P_34980, partial [Stackebrandtia sp.]